MHALALADLRRRSFMLIKFSGTVCTIHIHWNINNSQNFVKYMQCSAVVISGAFESSTELLITRMDQSKLRHSHSLCSNHN